MWSQWVDKGCSSSYGEWTCVINMSNWVPWVIDILIKQYAILCKIICKWDTWHFKRRKWRWKAKVCNQYKWLKENKKLLFRWMMGKMSIFYNKSFSRDLVYSDRWFILRVKGIRVWDSKILTLWHIYFELKTAENQKMQKEAFLELPLSD